MSRLNVIDSQSEIREGLAEQRGERYWRSLEELAESPGFEEMLHREFPRFAAEWTSDLDRRRFLQLSGASLALAGMAACTKQPGELIVPYVRQPEEVVPGNPIYFATSVTLAGFAVPVLAESHLGRPTKLEGNPEHPASLGGSDVFAQASVLDLYDPARLQAVTQLDIIRTWSDFNSAIGNKMIALEALSGDGLRILTGTVTSPTLGAQIETLIEQLPSARWHQYETANQDAALASARACFGAPLDTRYDLSQADVILAVDSDLLTLGPGAIRHAKEFAARRTVVDSAGRAGGPVNRLYCVETLATATGATADHRLALPPTRVAHFLLALAARLGVGGATMPAGFDRGREHDWIEAVAADLQNHRGRSLIVVGDEADVELHTLAHGINAALGNVGTTVRYSEPIAVAPIDQTASLAELVGDMEAGRVETLIILGANPVYDAPADLDFAAAMDKVPVRVFLGQRIDETGRRCHWQLPETHALEQWGDHRAHDGTVTLQQPIIVPLYGGKSAIEVMAAVLGETTIPADELIRRQHGDLDDGSWRKALHDGFIAGSAPAARAAAPNPGAVRRAAATVVGWTADGLELAFRLDPTVYDGRFANNGWLQECPKPLSKLTWDNALLMSPATADQLGFGDLVAGDDQSRTAPLAKLTVNGRELEVAVWALPGHADGAVTLHLGYGRTHCGPVGEGAGFDANLVRDAGSPWRVSSGVTVEKAGGRYTLATTQSHHSMEGRDLIRVADLETYRADPHVFDHHQHLDTSLSLMDGKDYAYDGYAWGMSIDLNSCTGCNACVVACQAENNIPTVGKEQVAKGREMHWIRIDRYFGGDADEVTSILHQPVTCMQCEQAPCEVVCPVAATVHSDEGLNDMVYNRCVGTRYCSNNCPYKVRRFNFLLYSDFETPSLQLGRNPDVTIRSRGVMEKCTYCVQRINHARVEAKREDRTIRDGAIKTACQQACPSDAIVFGDINDTDSAVTAAKALPRDYSLLAELGTRPRTTYLARIRNANPALAPVGVEDDHGPQSHA